MFRVLAEDYSAVFCEFFCKSFTEELINHYPRLFGLFYKGSYLNQPVVVYNLSDIIKNLRAYFRLTFKIPDTNNSASWILQKQA